MTKSEALTVARIIYGSTFGRAQISIGKEGKSNFYVLITCAEGERFKDSAAVWYQCDSVIQTISMIEANRDLCKTFGSEDHYPAYWNKLSPGMVEHFAGEHVQTIEDKDVYRR